MNKPVKIFIVEGEDRDYRFVYDMTQCFFVGKYETRIIEIPAGMNIYMLYNLLKKDDFDADIIEVLRDNLESIKKELNGITRQQVDEIFLFFDYDIQQTANVILGIDADDAVVEMLNFFDNETENGKLYISYPMVEALYDIRPSMCQTISNCLLPIEEIKKYKTVTGMGNPFASHSFKIGDWRLILSIFGLRLSCLFEDSIDYELYKEITPKEIYIKEQEIIRNYDNRLFVLSALPEFLYDYFTSKFWATHNTNRSYKYNFCPKGRANG